MHPSPSTQSYPRAKLVLALTVGILMGAGGVVAALSRAPGVGYRETAWAVAPIAATEAKVDAAAARSAPEPSGLVSVGVQLTDRERQVLARLASLPDLPIVQPPAFDVKVQAAPASKPQAISAGSAKQVAETPSALRGESVIARIQVVSVERGRVFYRSVDDQVHIARAGERLLGVNGRVLAIDEHGAELQIDGHRVRVTANNI